MLFEKIKATYKDDADVGDAMIVTALRDEALFRRLLGEVAPINVAVETGTNRGFATVVLEEFCREVHTFDIKDFPGRQRIFDLFSAGRSTFHLIANDAEKKRVLDTLQFDFAFLDGNHYKVADDFEMVRHCGRVLFHDYTLGFPPENQRSFVVRFVDTLDGVVTKEPPFAYWTDGVPK